MAWPQGLQRHRMQQSQFLVRLAQPALVDMHGRDVPPQGLGERVARSMYLLGQFACALERGQRRVVLPRHMQDLAQIGVHFCHAGREFGGLA